MLLLLLLLLLLLVEDVDVYVDNNGDVVIISMRLSEYLF